MKTLKQVNAEIEKLLEIKMKLQEKERIEKEKKEATEFQIIEHKGKEYRIYKWEKKSFKDFVCPNGFRWVNYSEFSELVNETKFEWEKYPAYYYSTNSIKNNYWELAGAYLDRVGGWYSSGGRLAFSYDDGRVVVVEGEKK